MPCPHGNSDRALDPGVSGLVCAEFSRNCLFRQNAAAQFSIFKWLHRGQATHSPLDSMAGFYNWSPSFPRRRLPSRLVNGATRREFYTKQEALGGDGCPPIGVSDGDDLPRIFFSTSPEHTWSKDIISHLPRIRPARPWRGLSQNFLIGTRQHGKSPGNRHSTSPHRLREHQTCRLFPRGLQRAPRPPCGWPRLHTVASRQSSGATAHNASSGPGIGTSGVGPATCLAMRI